MEEILDNLVLRIVFVAFIFILLIAYRFAHYFLYPNGRRQIKQVFNPLSNPCNSLHFFTRILGIAIVFTSLDFDYFYSLSLGSVHLFSTGLIAIILYLISIYLAESIILYKFDHTDEILKRENFSYAVTAFAIGISQAFIIRQVINQSSNSFIITGILWLLAMVLFGFSSKIYSYYSIFEFHKNIIQKKIGVALSYSGFLFGNTLLLVLAFEQEHFDIQNYILRVLLKVLLCLLIMPIFIKILYQVFTIKRTSSTDSFDDNKIFSLGLLEAIIYPTASILSSIVIYNINLSIIIPYAS